MPRGSYLVSGRAEAFSCAPGPAGWRYVSDAVDLALDAAFEVVRFEVRSGSAWARGGRTSLDDGTRVLTWTCSADPERERTAPVGCVDGESPAFLVALARAAAGPGDQPVRRTLRVVHFVAPVLAGVGARRVVARVGADKHEAPDGALLVEHWTVDDPDAGTRVSVHLAGDVVLAAEGSVAAGEVAVEVTTLESPPTGIGGARPR